jgi:uncharacterized protein YejL (UPF0352 family)
VMGPGKVLAKHHGPNQLGLILVGRILTQNGAYLHSHLARPLAAPLSRSRG